ncbi:MAG: hypothetical protein ACYC63_05695 [Armatimonadota bacterium]
MERPRSDAPRVQTDHVPRWLNYSGLSHALGLTNWSVFKALVEIQSRVMHLQPGKWNSGQVFEPFAVRVTAQLPHAVGTDAKTVRKALKTLDKECLIVYEPGKARRGTTNDFSRITICERMIEALSWYALPHLPAHLGGISDLTSLPERFPVWLAADIDPVGYTREQLEEMLWEVRSARGADERDRGSIPKDVAELMEFERDCCRPWPPDWCFEGLSIEAEVDAARAWLEAPQDATLETTQSLMYRMEELREERRLAAEAKCRSGGTPWPPEPPNRIFCSSRGGDRGFSH